MTKSERHLGGFAPNTPWFSQVDFGEVFIPPNLEVPKPRVLPEFKRLAHGLRSDNISILDAKTFYIPNLHYDGAGPDAYFWVGNGSEPSTFGIKVPNEMGSLDPLRGYQGTGMLHWKEEDYYYNEKLEGQNRT